MTNPSAPQDDIDRRSALQPVSALQESARFLSSVLSNLPGLVYRCRNDRDWTVEFISEGCLALTGYPASDFIQNSKRTYAELIHPDDREAVWNDVQAAVTEKRPFQLTYRIQVASGEEKWVWEQGCGVFTDTGALSALEGFITDITQRKRAEEELTKREMLLAESQRLAHLGSWEWDVATDRAIWSDELYRILGFEPQAQPGSYELFLRAVHPDDRAPVRAVVQQSLHDHRPYAFECRVVWPDGTTHTHFVRGEVVLDAGGRPIRLYGFAQDITARRQAEEALHISRELLHNIIDSTPSYVFAIDLGHHYILVNDALARLFGMFKQEILGKTERDVFPQSLADTLHAINAEIMTTGTPQQNEHVVMTKGTGVARVVMTTKFPLRDARGKVSGLGGVATDITERKHAEQELQASLAQLRALADHLQTIREDERTTLAREIHDEFGGALTGLKMDLAWMERKLTRLNRPEETRELADKMCTMADRLDETIGKIRTIATELRPGVLDLGLVAAIEWQAQEFGRRTGIACCFDLAPAAAELDRHRSTAVFRIFQEILTNVARHAKAVRVTGLLSVENKQMLLEVCDDGIGIDQRRLHDARSLDLLGMRERALLLDGTLEIRGRPRRGTTVTLRIPIKSANETAISAENAPG